MRVKDLEERLRKCEADKRLVEEKYREDNHLLRAELDELKCSLGNRSSYAVKAARSVRSLVELLEQQKVDLKTQLDRLLTEMAAIQENRDELRHRNERLEEELRRLRDNALEEAAARVENDYKRVKLECKALKEENNHLKERVELLQEAAKRDGASHTETVKLFENKVDHMLHSTRSERNLYM